ncbi:MAG TPA: GAF domain-containing protein [Gaiellales bacterium]|nr:GAF domain-containing protein [Gaiellales bacterium]
MSVSHTSVVPSDTPERTVESRYLYRIINTVSSTLDLDRVLRAIVDLVSEAIDCHACWIYFVDPDDGGLVLRAVSDPYAALVGRLRFEPGEGLAGWVAEHNRPVFIPENAPDDPRAKVVPEAEEEKYGSLCAAPLRTKAGSVIGVIALHAEAPREFTRADSDFLVHAATLVAGAVENARLYEDTRRRLSQVEGLSDLARALSAASTLESLLPAVARRAQRLLEASSCDVLIADAEGRTLSPGAAWPQGSEPPHPVNVHELGLELALSARGGGEKSSHRLATALWDSEVPGTALVVPMVAAEELVGVLALRFAGDHRVDAEQRELAGSIANQAAVAIKKVQLIDRLTERNAIKDLLEDLSHGNAPAAELQDRAATLGCDLTSPHLVLQAAPRPGPNEGSWDAVAEALEQAVTRAFPGSIFDRRDAALRGLIRLNGCDEEAAAERLREIHARLAATHPLAIGLSNSCEGAESYPNGFSEADHAVVAASVVNSEPGVTNFDDLGAYKYLLKVSQDGRVRDRRGEALQRLAAYDQRHRSQLLLTLEEYLRRRGNIAAAAQTLYVHPNTLRQRLRRIQDLTGLDVAREDWLMIEIELKLLRLDQALGR